MWNDEPINNACTELKVLVLSQYDEQNLILHMVDKGAHGYLLKTADPEELEKAIRNVMTNGYHNSEVLTKALFNKEKNKKQQKALKGKNADISVRELEVLKLLCRGSTTPEIADKLFRGTRTIETHRMASVWIERWVSICALEAAAWEAIEVFKLNVAEF